MFLIILAFPSLKMMQKTEKLDNDRTVEIGGILGEDYKLIVDVAMGESANAEELAGQVKDNVSKPEWYGFIRLMCWVNVTTAAGKILMNDDELVTCVVPTGNKVTYLDGYEAYFSDASPDKGCVAAYFPNAQIVLTSTHLAGTNQYGVPEEVFDTIRITQLGKIEHSLSHLVERYATVPTSLSETALVMCGDLNFRVESKFTGPEDKVKGGKDFKTIERVATSGDGSALSDLFEDHDRLHKLLRGKLTNSTSLPSHTNSGATSLCMPSFVIGCADAVGESLLEQATSFTSSGDDERLLRPTFTFKVDAKHPRSYKDKRTPSWTDRILVRGFGRLLGPVKGGKASVLKCKSLPHVVCSDHEPVIAIIGLGRHVSSDLTVFSEEMAVKHAMFLNKPQRQRDLELESDTDYDLQTQTSDCWGGLPDSEGGEEGARGGFCSIM